MIVDSIAADCFRKTGLYPLSFCLPRKKLRPFNQKAKQKDLSFIVPGDLKTFVFKDEDSYMSEYQTSRFAITKKKGGWDCVRHLEIMAASSVPLFENIETCPPFTLTHYPKNIFQEINLGWKSFGSDEYVTYQKKIYQWFENHLTSDQMVRYMLRVTKNESAKSILFVDSSLPTRPDCLSAMILGGLKDLFSTQCEVVYPVDCLYEDRPFPKKPRWWKTNFNIYQILQDSHRSQNETLFDLNRICSKVENHEYDLVVFGSVTRSLDLFDLVKAFYPKEKILGINGEDSLSGLKNKLSKSLKLWVRAQLRREKHQGPLLNPFLSDTDAWQVLRAKIEPHCNLFMREIGDFS